MVLFRECNPRLVCSFTCIASSRGMFVYLFLAISPHIPSVNAALAAALEVGYA